MNILRLFIFGLNVIVAILNFKEYDLTKYPRDFWAGAAWAGSSILWFVQIFYALK